MVVLVPRKRQAVTLDGVTDEADRAVMSGCRFEGFEEARHVMPAKVRHERLQLVVGAAFNQGGDRPLISNLVEEPLAPGRASLEGQRRIELVLTPLDPLTQLLASQLSEGCLLQRTMAQDHHVPAEVAENLLEPLPEALPDHGVERLAVVVYNPPTVAKTVLPGLWCMNNF